MLARSPYIPSPISFAMFGTSAFRSSNRSFGVPQSRPITTTLGPCCIRSSPPVLPLRCLDAALVRARAAGPEHGTVPDVPRQGSGTAVRVCYQPVRAGQRVGGATRMAFLQRVLKIQAALWALSGMLLLLVPRWLLHDAFGQPPMREHAWIRAMGVMAIVLAMLMVLVAQRVTDVWWWRSGRAHV